MMRVLTWPLQALCLRCFIWFNKWTDDDACPNCRRRHDETFRR